MPKVAVVYYSMYGHVAKMSDAVVEGLKKNEGLEVTLFQIKETLPQEVLDKMYAPPKRENVPVVTPKDLEAFDGVLMGIPTRYGNMPAQWKTFIDATGQQWKAGAYHGKYVGIYTSTATQHGGQETTIMSTIPVLAALGMIYVPLGYANCYPELGNVTEVVGGSPYGAGTITNGDGSRQPSELELKIASVQGEQFGKTVLKAFRA
eukprot:TRINITY_DN5482_c0_g1_i1.p1 TRINITY_DN5482_c0_g1~~TRINITY_DN5482_c0_g1_i1.p1  ORF type:complete len:205 (-),score=55.06 TRINITY_DN5482_c0_g1_i1:62-676(-)